MKIKELNIKNKCYDKDLLRKYKSLYEGGKTFKENIGLFLNKNIFEGQDDYISRCKEACYEPYINTLVNQFGSQLFSSPFEIKMDRQNDDEFYMNFKEDCDLIGTDLSTFVHKLFTNALVKGSSWLLAKMPDDEGVPAQSLAEFKERELGRVWINCVETEDVYDWEVDDVTSQYLLVITHDSQKKRVSPRDDRRIVTETWRIYDSEYVETFQIRYRDDQMPSEETIVPSLGKIKHGFTRVPLLRLEIPIGLWLTNRLADAAIEQFRMDNALGWAMRRSCYPVWVYNASDSENVRGSLIKSSDGFGVMIGENEKFAPQSPDSKPFEQIAARVNNKKDELHRLALQMALAIDNTASAVRRSGESKAQDVQATEIILYAYADLVKGFIETLYELISDSRGDVELTFSIEGMDKFIIDDTESILRSATMAQKFPFLMKSQTFNTQLANMLSSILLPRVSDEIKKQISDEINEISISDVEAEEKPDNSQPVEQEKESP